MRRSIRVEDVKDERMAAALLIPMLVTGTGASGGVVRLAGAPGTVAVPAPAPNSVRPIPGSPQVQNSTDGAPNQIHPRLFVTYPDGMYPPVALRSNNELPIPAGSVIRTPVVAQRAPRQGGRSVTPWPRAFQRWPSVTGSDGD